MSEWEGRRSGSASSGSEKPAVTFLSKPFTADITSQTNSAASYRKISLSPSVALVHRIVKDAGIIAAVLILGSRYFGVSSIFRHVAVFEEYLLALAGQLQLTGCQVVTSVGAVGMDLALQAVICNERR